MWYKSWSSAVWPRAVRRELHPEERSRVDNTPSLREEPGRGRATLPARCYTDPEFFALDHERIFARTWQPVGRLEQLQRAGDFVATEAVGGEPIVLVRDGRGELRAYSNVCRHRAGSVAEGCGNRQTLQCSYHGWTYTLDGKLLGAPEFEGVENFDRACYGLPPVRVATLGPIVFVNLDPTAPPLESTLGEVVEQKQPAG